MRFGLQGGTLICFSYIGRDLEHTISPLTRENPWSMKWEMRET
jgi:hypothetical protein